MNTKLKETILTNKPRIFIFFLILTAQALYAQEPSLHINASNTKTNLYVGLTLGEGSGSAANNLFSENNNPSHVMNFNSESNNIARSGFTQTLILGYDFLSLNKLTLSPEIYFTHIDNSKNTVSNYQLGPARVKQTNTAKFGNQFALDFKLNYNFDNLNRIYAKVGWGLMRVSVRNKYSIMSNDTDWQHIHHQTKNVPGILFGIGFSHNVTAHISVSIEWREFRPKDSFNSSVTNASFLPGEHITTKNSLDNITMKNISIGLSYKF